MLANLENSAVDRGLEKVSFYSNPKERQCQRMLKLPHNCTHLKPDILECEVKWALGSITMKKASGGDGIPVELFQILKDDAVKVHCTQYASKFGKFSSGHGTGKVSLHFNLKEGQ